MSMQLTALMIQHGPADPLAKLLALCLTDRANVHDLCWPSRSDLKARSGASDATITRKLRMLEAEGYIARKQQHDGPTVFRINAAKLRKMDAEWQASRAVRVPEGFEPFAEEMERAPVPKALQAIENNGDAHCDVGDAHCDAGDAHGEQLTNHKPIKNLGRSAGSARPVHRQPRRLPPDGVGASAAPVDAAAAAAKLSPFQRKLVREGHGLVLDGQHVAAGSSLMLTLQAQLSDLERGASCRSGPSPAAAASLVGAVARACENKGAGNDARS